MLDKNTTDFLSLSRTKRVEFLACLLSLLSETTRLCPEESGTSCEAATVCLKECNEMLHEVSRQLLIALELLDMPRYPQLTLMKTLTEHAQRASVDQNVASEVRRAVAVAFEICVSDAGEEDRSHSDFLGAERSRK
jgi:hypothetical protein